MAKPLPPPACVHIKCMPPTTHYMAPLWQSWKQNIQPLHSMQNWTWHPGAPDKLSQQEGLRNQYINQKSINQSICTHMQYIQITKILKRRQKTQMHQISFCCMKNLEINTSTSNEKCCGASQKIISSPCSINSSWEPFQQLYSCWLALPETS